MSTIILNGGSVNEHTSDKISVKENNMVSSEFQSHPTNKMSTLNFRGSPDEHNERLQLCPSCNCLYEGEADECSKETSLESEIKSMGDFMLIKLDLIQQQSEQLGEKAKIINSLKTENENLRLRCLRMERRLSLQRNRSGEPSTSSTVRSKSSSTSRKLSPSRSRLPSESQESTSTTPLRDGSSDSRGNKRRVSTSAEPNFSNACRVRFSPSKDTYHKPRRKDQKFKSSSRIVSRNLKPLKSECYLTQQRFHSVAGQENPFKVALLEVGSSSPPHSRSTLEVPSWRIKQYTSSYSLEGTENLSDEMFEKRHGPKLIEERRRKRWDAQRLREQRTIERLKKRDKWRGDGREEGGGTSQVTPRATTKTLVLQTEPDTFWFDLNSLVEILVKDIVPVGVFGLMLPPPGSASAFLLPWALKGPRLTSYAINKGKR